MEKICHSPPGNDDLQAYERETPVKLNISCEIRPRTLSPVFQSARSVEKVRCVSSSDEEIPTYQIAPCSKRFSDRSDKQELILPISPISTPPSDKRSQNINFPIVHTLGSILKNNVTTKADINEETESTSVTLIRKHTSVFDELGIMDQDISWVSSMETPAQQPLPLKEFTTIEKATFLPDDCVGVHRRALFSPYKNDEYDCEPLKYSSDGDDEISNYSNYSTKVKISETLNMVALEVMEDISQALSNGAGVYCQSSDIELKNNFNQLEIASSPLSPVFRTKKNKIKKKKRKHTKALLVQSPDATHESFKTVKKNPSDSSNAHQEMVDCDISFSKDKTCAVDDAGDSHYEGPSISIPDDSFDNMSFSCIDELCKNLSTAGECSECTNIDHTNPAANEDAISVGKEKRSIGLEPLSVTKERTSSSKRFYNIRTTGKVHQIRSMDDLLMSARRLEEDVIVQEKKLDAGFINKDLIVFNHMIGEVLRSDLSVRGSTASAKRMRSDVAVDISPASCQKKKVKFDRTEESPLEPWPSIGAREENDTPTNLDAQKWERNEKILFSNLGEENGVGFAHIIRDECMPANMLKNSVHNGADNRNKVCAADTERVNGEIGVELSDEKFESAPKTKKQETREDHGQNFPTFCTALGKPVSVSNETYRKVRNIFSEELEACDELGRKCLDEEVKNNSSNGFSAFKTASGNAVNISEDSLNKVRGIFREFQREDSCDTTLLDSRGSLENAEFSIEKSETKMSEEPLQNGRERSGACRITDICGTEQKKENSPERYKFHSPVGFRTASNKRVNVSKESLRKVRTLWIREGIEEELGDSDEENKNNAYKEGVSRFASCSEAAPNIEIGKSENPRTEFCGFMTASEKNVAVSEDSVQKARKILRENEDVCKERKSYAATEQVNSSGFEERLWNAELSATDKLLEKDATAADKDDCCGNRETMPSWLHVYNTSPNFLLGYGESVADSPEGECLHHSTPKEQYLIKSPVLATTDRFSNRRRNRNQGRKLHFDVSPISRRREEKVKTNFTVPHEMEVKSPAKAGERGLSLNFASPFRKQVTDEVVPKRAGETEIEEVCVATREGRKQARFEQELAGKKEKVKPIKGSHLMKKEEAQTKWWEAVGGVPPGRYPEDALRSCGIRNDVLRITVSNAGDYRFRLTDFYSSEDSRGNMRGFPVGDGCTLIFSDDNTAGIEEFARAFLASPGVDRNLISGKWITNHYKWIVWKLGRYEMSYPHIFGGRCLTPQNVMLQLKYRYDREIDRGHRSALKRILERDDSASKRMVLRVFDVKKVVNNSDEVTGNSNTPIFSLGLTDGWYGCYAKTDSAMTRLIEDERITVGTKLITQGAELVNCDQGIPPLEAEENIHLKISTNSTRRATWNTKLGFQRNCGPLLVSLSSVLPHGGYVGRLDVLIMRVYPVLYMEKRWDGTHVLRNRRTEEKAAASFYKEKESRMEKIYQDAKNEMENKEKSKEKCVVDKLIMSNISKITDPDELYKLYENYTDPSTFQNLLTVEQKEMLINYQWKRNETIQKGFSALIQEKLSKEEKMCDRKVSEMLKIKIVDLKNPDYGNAATLTVWNPTEDVSALLTEGKAVSIFNTTIGHSRSPRSVQLNSMRSTRYREIAQTAEYPIRKVTRLHELTADFEPFFNEIDLVGIVVFVRESNHGSSPSQTIFVADSDFNFAGIVFWGNCKDLGWENILKINSIVACSNLQWRRHQFRNSIPRVCANIVTVFTENPKQEHLTEEMKRLKASLPQDTKSFAEQCEEQVRAKVDDHRNASNSSWSASDLSFPADVGEDRGGGAFLKPKYINGFKMKPSAWSTPVKSTIAPGFCDADHEPSPIEKKIEKLLIYGEPPPLSPLLPMDGLKKFRTKFKVPFKNVTS